MENSYDFSPENIPNITLQLLVDSFAFQQATLSVVLDHFNIPESEKNDIVNEINVQKGIEKEKVLQALFASFGKTPDV